MNKDRTGCWFTEPAKEILDGALRLCPEQPRIFEFGIGNSTIYLKDKCRLLVSVEHDPEWIDLVKRSSIPAHVKLILQEKPYHKVVEQFDNDFFDIIIVDGRNRVKCIQSSISKIRSGGWLILDNSEREYYQPGIELMNDWNRIDCRQMRPDAFGFTYPRWTTTIFIKP